MAVQICPQDDSFGPAVHGCRDDFDFTIMFERIFFALVPASIFIPIFLARILSLIRQPPIVNGMILRSAKLVVAVAYASLHLSLLILNSTAPNPNTLSLASTLMTFECSLCIIVLSYLDHARSPRPSAWLSIYLLLTILLDVAQTRTIWLTSVNSKHVIFGRVFTATIVVKAFLLLLESQHKTKWMEWDEKKHSPEEKTGVFGLAAFTWLNRLFAVGYKRTLTLDDVFSLDGTMATETLQQNLMTTAHVRSFRGKKFWLARALAKQLAVPLVLPVLPRICLSTFKFCQPFFILTLLDLLQSPKNPTSTNKGYGLIGAAVFIYCGIAVSTAFYWYFHERAICMARGTLAGIIYQKTTEARLSEASDSAALTLMGVDLERIRLGFVNLHEFWANTIEVAIASWLLYRQLGAAFVAPLIVVLCCIAGAGYANRFTGRRQKAWMDKIQRRVALTANIVSNMKHLKISGLTGPVEELIQNMRVEELKTASNFRTVHVIVVTLGYAPTALAPVMAFAVTSRTLDVTTIFTSMSFLILLADPLAYIFQNTPNLLAGLACLDRIQTFLEKDSRNDYRLLDYELSDTVQRRASVGSGTQEHLKPDSRSAVDIIDGNFGWEPNKPVLRNINIRLPQSGLTILIGPVASGKSTLCKGLLGELSGFEGQVTISPSLMSRKAGYCDQISYLFNGTIRQNIIGFSPFSRQRYREVIEATMLVPDLAAMQDGDETKVGNNGIALSGGQKQRVSMARSLYLDTNFFIFDDILSGLDADTEEQVFRRVFGPGGLLQRRRATALLCTHNIQHLPHSDHIIALDANGSIAEQGSYKQLATTRDALNGLRLSMVSNKSSIQITAMSDGDEASILERDRMSTAQVIGQSFIDADSRRTGVSSVHRYYIASLGKLSLLAFVIFGFGWGFFYNWGNVWLTFWSEDITNGPPSRSNSFYIGLYSLFQTCFLASMFFLYMICYRTMVQVSGATLHKAALSTVIRAPLRFFTTTDTGVVTNLFSQDMNLIDAELPIAVTNLAMDTCNAVAMAAVIATSSPFLALTYPVISVSLYFIQRMYLRTSRQLRLLDLEAKTPLYSHFLDTIKGIATFRAFGWTPMALQVNKRLLEQSQRPYYLLSIVQRWLAFALQIIVAVLAVTVVVMATQLRPSVGLTGASLVTLMTFGDVLNYIIRWFTQMETSIGAVGRVKSFSDNVKSENVEGEDLVPPKEWPVQGAIQITGVSASYSHFANTEEESSGADGTDVPNIALRDLTLSIQPGERVAICGRSGSGKSSTILLLLRLLDPLPSCSRNIMIDDIPLHKIDRSALRQQIIAIPQDPVFLPDGSSFMANLDPYSTATEDEYRVVLEALGLWPIVEQRGGLTESMSSDTLSQGQKQLFSLARAIIRRKIRTRESSERASGGILLLDEISSNVDHNTERAMQQIIQREFEGYTILMVSHRLDVVMDFDRVIIMDEGSVVEAGPPKSLVEIDDSRFQELWSIGRKHQIKGSDETGR